MNLSYDKDPSPEEVEELRRKELEQQAIKRRELEEKELAALREAKARQGGA